MMSVRTRGQVLPVVGIVVLVLFTLGNAAANMIPVHRPTETEVRAVERQTIIEQRRMRIIQLRTAAVECHAASAHELARLLVMDGQWDAVRTFGRGYDERCGEDPVVRHWSAAPQPRKRR